jgi:hypothetical protein
MPYARVLLLVAIAVAALSGCGSAISASDDRHGGGDLAAVESPLVDAKGGADEYIVESSDPIYTKKVPRILSYPTGRDNDETSETGAGPVETCRLVSPGDAATILGGAVQVTQEPQGPTCVYALQGSEQQVTLVVEDTRLASLRGHARKASPLQIAGHSGWCLHYESTSVAVPLADGRVLHVAGPCADAARFAARALAGGSGAG